MPIRQLSRLVTLFCVAIPAAVGVVVSSARATDGALDPTFDADGIVTTDLTNSDVAYSVVIQPDGKIVVAGYTISGNQDFALARYNTNGSLDTTFDTDGKLTTDLGGNHDQAFSVALQPDGKIVVAGKSTISGVEDFALARYNTNGSLDTTFDTDGKLTTDLGGTNSEARSMALQPDGKIVVVGSTNTSGNQDFALARYNTNGSLDTTFDTDGKLTTDLTNSDVAYSVVIQPDGKIVVAGHIISGNEDFALARYNTNGSLDTTFDTDGKLTTDLGGNNDQALSMALQPDGKIVVAGYSAISAGGDFALARYNTNGSLDTTFDTDGKLTTDLGGNNEDVATSTALQPDGKIVVAGYTNPTGGNYDFALARYHSNGTLDTTFDSDGKLITDLGGPDDEAQSMALQPDGKIVVAGFSNASGIYDFAMVRYEAAPLATTLAASTATSSSASITFTMTGSGTIDCSTLSSTSGVDFDLTGITAITSITQTSPTVCTITATSSAIADGVAVTSALTAAASFSVGFTNGNTRREINGSPQSVIVTIPAPTTTTMIAPSTTVTPTTTAAATTTTVPGIPSRATINALPVASPPLVTESSFIPGQPVTLTLGRFTPGAFIQLVVASTPRVIGKGYAKANGTVTLSGTLPTSLSAGEHTLAVYSPATGKGFRQTITVTATNTLPAAGLDTSLLTLFGLSLLATGVLFTARRRLIRCASGALQFGDHATGDANDVSWCRAEVVVPRSRR